jgi:hypothetical protein
MKMKTLAIAAGMLLLGATVMAQDTLFFYGWEPETEPGPIGTWWINTGKTWITGTATGDTAYTGTTCLKADVYADAAQNWDNQCAPEGIEVEDSTAYRLGFWARVDGGTATVINITCGQYVNWTELSRKGNVPITPEWERYFLQVYIKDASALPLHAVVEGEDTVEYPNHIRFPLHFYRIGTYYVDDITILKSNIAYAVAAGNTLTVNFGWKLDWADEIDQDAFTVTVNGAPVGVESVVMRDLGDLVEPWIDLTLDTEVVEGDAVRVSFAGGSGLYYTGLGPITDDMGSAEAFTDEVAEYGVIESPVGIQDVDYSNVNIAYDGTYLRIMDIQDIRSVSLYSMSGQRIRYIDKSFDAIAIDDLTKGAYIIKVQAVNGTFTGKFIK